MCQYTNLIRDRPEQARTERHRGGPWASKLPNLGELILASTSTAVVLAGCGGTGAQIGRMLAPHLRHAAKEPETPPSSSSTTTRSNRTTSAANSPAGDVGQNKAEVLARRFNMALGLNIEARTPHHAPKT